jgi:hypothetical protein
MKGKITLTNKGARISGKGDEQEILREGICQLLKNSDKVKSIEYTKAIADGLCQAGMITNLVRKVITKE